MTGLTDHQVLLAAAELLTHTPRVRHLRGPEAADALKAHLMLDPHAAAYLMAVRDQDALSQRLSAFMDAARTIPRGEEC